MMRGRGMPAPLIRAALLSGVLLRRGHMGQQGLSCYAFVWRALEALAWARWGS